MVDSHSHLNHPDFAADLPQVMARAQQAGVGSILVVGYDLESSRRALSLCAAHADLWATVGISPHDAGTFTEAALGELETLARQPRVVAIGEIGLDYHWRTHSPARQQHAYRRQLALAASLRLPVVVHSREATPDTLQELALLPGVRGVLHCFSGTAGEAERALELGCYLGVAGNITYQGALALRQVVAGLSRDRVLVETDSPYLAPQPRRGMRNEPSFLPFVVDRVAALWGAEPAAVAAATAANARCCFDRLSG